MPTNRTTKTMTISAGIALVGAILTGCTTPNTDAANSTQPPTSTNMATTQTSTPSTSLTPAAPAPAKPGQSAAGAKAPDGRQVAVAGLRALGNTGVDEDTWALELSRWVAPGSGYDHPDMSTAPKLTITGSQHLAITAAGPGRQIVRIETSDGPWDVTVQKTKHGWQVLEMVRGA